MKQHDFNIYVGAETGVLKGVNINDKNVIIKNFHNLKKLEKEQEICSMAWGDQEEVDIVLGIRSQKVRTYDSEFNGFSSCMETPAGEGPVIGVARFEGAVVTASESGVVKLWKTKQKESIEISAGGPGKNIARLRQNHSRPSVVATGGKENALQLWDLTAPEKPLFRSKNVKNDMLNLRVPIWVSDMAFLPESERIATTSRHSQIRVYSPKEQFRPVIDFNFEDEPLTCLSTASKEWELIVGTGRGRLALFDIRQKKLVHSFKGLVGGLKEVVCHKTRPYVASVSLDRHLRIHDLNTKKLLYKDFCLPVPGLRFLTMLKSAVLKGSNCVAEVTNEIIVLQDREEFLRKLLDQLEHHKVALNDTLTSLCGQEKTSPESVVNGDDQDDESSEEEEPLEKIPKT